MSTENKCLVTVVATFNEGGNESNEYQQYAAKAKEIIEENKGVVTGRYKAVGNAGNGNTPHAVLTIEYPTIGNAENTFTSAEYKEIIPLRDVAFKDIDILIAGAM